MSDPMQSDGARTISPTLPPTNRRETSPAPLTMMEFAGRVLLAVLIVALAYLAWRGAHVLLLTFAGILLAVFLSGVSEWLSRRTGMRYGRALAAVVLALVLVLGAVAWFLANRLAMQAEELARQLPRAVEQIRTYLEGRPWGRPLLEKAPQVAQSFAERGDFSRLTGLVSGVAGLLEAAIVIVVVGIFGAAEPDVYKQGLLYLVPPGRRRRVAEALEASAASLRGWVMGQLFLMIVIGATTALGLWLLGVPLALTLGMIAGILELIPYIGAWLSAVPAALIALLVSPWRMAATLGLFLLLHILEGYVLAPLVQRRAIHLPPALTLVAQILLGHLAGPLGLFVAAPLTVVAIVFIKTLYVQDALGDQPP